MSDIQNRADEDGNPLVSFPENFSELVESMEANGVRVNILVGLVSKLIYLQLESQPQKSIFWATEPELADQVQQVNERYIGLSEEIIKGLEDIRKLDEVLANKTK